MTLSLLWSSQGLSTAVRHCPRQHLYQRLRIGAPTPMVAVHCYRTTATTTAAVSSTAYTEPVDVPLSSPLPLSSFNRYRALVLDTSYRPIDIVNWQRAICLDLFDKVDVLEYYDALVHSARAEFMIPAVLRVRMYVQRDNRGKISLTRYCGSNVDLTVDHVTPVSKGGLWEWSNLVTACNTCNGKKGSKTLKQMGWKLKKMPTAPSSWQVGILVGPEVNFKYTPKEWADYLFPGSQKEEVPAPASFAGLDPLTPPLI